MEDKDEGDTAKEGVRLRHLSALLELSEGGILGELEMPRGGEKSRVSRAIRKRGETGIR